MKRCAAIDVGTNTVLLLVAERQPDGAFTPLLERAEITRLGRGVDRTGQLDPAAIRETVAVLAAYAREARALGAEAIACVATSAARDAANSAEFFEAARREAGLTPEVISGDEEARLVYESAWRDFGPAPGGPSPLLPPGGPLAVVDVGGGSTELTWGDGPVPRDRRSLQLGAVRLTERHVHSDPLSPAEVAALRAAAAEGMRALAPWRDLGQTGGARLVGVAGTVTTLSAVEQGLERYDAGQVHGAVLTLEEVERLYGRLAGLTVSERARLPGMEPKRADVIVGGCAVVAEAMLALGFDRLTVSDRGVRWGLLYDRVARGKSASHDPRP